MIERTDSRSWVRNRPGWPWHVEIVERPDCSIVACGMTLAPFDAPDALDRTIEIPVCQCERCMEALAGLEGDAHDTR